MNASPNVQNDGGATADQESMMVISTGPTIPPLPAVSQRMDMVNAVEAGDWLAVGCPEPGTVSGKIFGKSGKLAIGECTNNFS